MDIYLDIDGVIVGTASPARDVEALITFILDRFPDSVYWLTTHCRGGENRTRAWLRGKISDPVLDRLCAKARPTDWDVLKTEAINFSRLFVWLDDSLLFTERKVLQDHGALDSWIPMNKRDPGAAKAAVSEIARRLGE